MVMSFSELLGPGQSFLALSNPAVKQQIRQNDIDLERAKLRLDSSMSPEMPGSRGIATPIEEVLPGKITTPAYQPPSNKMTTPIQERGRRCY